MKIASIIILIFIGFTLESFKHVELPGKINSLHMQDSIPEMNKQIIAFVKTKIKTKVGTGECWDLAAEALKSVNASWNMPYNFGREINYKIEPVFPGDIIQFEGVQLNYIIDNKKYTEKMSHHTAIIFEVKNNSNFILAHQNNGYSGKKVGLSPLELNTLTRGKIKIFRPKK